ncbi:MAG: hypothetical protein NC307_02555 [Roseburia sp.]|nr:hypothetical protein [Roseburia sp.]
MDRDILFQTEEFIFSYRVGGLLIRNHKILLQKPGNDDLDHERIDLDFCWVSLEKLKNGLKVYPLELIPYILNDNDGIVHFVSKETFLYPRYEIVEM